MADLTPNAVAVIPAVLRADESGAVVLCMGDAQTLMTTDHARRLADILRAVAAEADGHAAALRSPEAKALDAANGHFMGRA